MNLKDVLSAPEFSLRSCIQAYFTPHSLIATVREEGERERERETKI